MPSQPPPPLKTGPLSVADLLQVWRAVTDPSYSDPILAAGEGQGEEVITQGLAQFAQASQAVDTSTQAMFILPWSGQTAPPAGGAAKATLTAQLSRSLLLPVPLTLVAGQVLVQESTTDFGPTGPVPVLTGRRYVVAQTTTLGPGEQGPVPLQLVAERSGYGYNSPLPDSVTAFVQPGLNMHNAGAVLTPSATAGHRLAVAPQPDVVQPEHVGRYVQLTTGPNAGQVRRAVGYASPTVGGTSPDGGTLVLAPTGVYRLSLQAGEFSPGEALAQPATGATGTLVYLTGDARYLVLDRTSGTFAVGDPIVGQLSGAVGLPDSVEQSPDLAADPSVAWRVLAFDADFGATLSHDQSPTGGRAAMLDELGAERKVGRGPGEVDDRYRRRVATPADVVSPGAVQRAANRVLAPLGFAGYLREVGTGRLPGLYFDGDPSDPDPSVAYAFDLDFDARPQDAYKLAFSYLEFRAFFLMGVPALQTGDFGCFFDGGLCDAFDAAPWLAFFDGFPVTAAITYRHVWQELQRVKAGGVGFDLYVESAAGV